MSFFPLGTPTPIEILFLTRRYAYDVNGDTEYIGLAKPGTGDSDSGWMILKHAYTDRVLQNVKLASGTNKFDKIWNDGVTTYASYTYS